MRLTKSQICQLSKWAKSGLVRVHLVMRDLPEWAPHDEDYALGRELVRLAKIGQANEISRGAERSQAKSIAKIAAYRNRSIKAALTVKRMKALRAEQAKEAKVDVGAEAA